MSRYDGFWSYVHKDDEVEGMRISKLARDLVGQFELLTGETINLFLDKDAIKWGEFWRGKINEGLASVAFFIPVITPRYFMSPECRRELQFFARKAKDIGVKELVMPLHYIDTPSIEEDNPKDELAKFISDFQWVDWRELRFSEVTSEQYRRGVAILANRLVEANRMAEETESFVALSGGEKDSTQAEESNLGVLDRLAITEDAISELKEILYLIGQDFGLIASFLERGADDVEKSNIQKENFKRELGIIQNLSQKIDEPIERVVSNGNKFVTFTHDIDLNLRIIIDQAPREIIGEINQERLNLFFQSIIKISEKTEDIAEKFKEMKALAPLENVSRDLRHKLRRFRKGLSLIIEANEVSTEWVQKIHDLGIYKREPYSD